ncbi:DUF1361 domain-containing protein [Cytophagaceae bacterium SJW1-29]|uniref:DUF1361 domain-containing protein n=2 Tax=Salmonirosea aquatica TaxID=2654236 RepID=A0A7C9F4G7_9BACT|nr:DUF1361 domain-containing protein [Cytophagaceae bacterium SJW1-29]
MLAVLSLLAFAFHFIRIQFSEAVDFSLDWNLLLSWIPLLIAFLARYLSKNMGPLPWVIGMLSVVWLAFFPNAPYMITDLVHLSVNYESDRTWHDAIMLFYYAQISLINGLVSLYWFHGAWNRTYSKRVGTILLFLSFPLGGLGVYLGRILRINSWDLFHKPGQFFLNVFENLYDRTALLLIVEFGLLLGTLYAMLWGLLKFRARRQNRVS